MQTSDAPRRGAKGKAPTATAGHTTDVDTRARRLATSAAAPPLTTTPAATPLRRRAVDPAGHSLRERVTAVQAVSGGSPREMRDRRVGAAEGPWGPAGRSSRPITIPGGDHPPSGNSRADSAGGRHSRQAPRQGAQGPTERANAPTARSHLARSFHTIAVLHPFEGIGRPGWRGQPSPPRPCCVTVPQRRWLGLCQLTADFA